MHRRATTTSLRTRWFRRIATVGLCATTLFGATPAGADDAAVAGSSLQYIGAFADLAGQPEVGDILTMAGMLIGATSQDSTGAQIDRINTAITRIQTDVRLLSEHMSDLQNAQNLNALAIAQTWNVQSLQDLTEKTDSVRKSVDEVLQPLSRTPVAEIDEVSGSGGDPFANRFHAAAYGVAASTIGEADSFLDLRYRPYGGGCQANGGAAAGIVGDCSPNPLWVVSTVAPVQVQDRDAEGNLRSYGMVDGTAVAPSYRFRPEVGLGTYFADLRVAIAAMETDMGGQDMAAAKGTVLVTGKYAYFRSKYARLFTRHIAFLTYAQAPADPAPDGAGSADYVRYVTHTNTSLSNAYYIAMRRGQAGMNPKVWMAIDQMRDLLTYAQVHGTSRGWRYSEPDYIAQYIPPSDSGLSQRAGTQRQLSAAAEAAQAGLPGPDDVNTFLIGADARGAAFALKLVVSGSAGTLTPSASPFWTQPDLSALVSSGESGVIGVTQYDSVSFGTVGGGFAPVSGGPGFALLSPRGLFGGGDGVLYGVSANGALIWTRLAGGVAAPARTVGSGWAAFRQVVGAGHGVVYALTDGGELLWYRHRGYLEGSTDWLGPISIAQGWDRYSRIVAGANGVLIGVKSDGTADFYHHRDFLTGVSVAAAAAGGSPRPMRDRVSGAPLRAFGAAGATVRSTDDLPRTSPHLAGPIALSGANLSEFQVLSGALDITVTDGRIK